MTKVMAKCVFSDDERFFTVGEMYEVTGERRRWFSALDNDGEPTIDLPWSGGVWKFERIKWDKPPTTIEEMLAVVEAAGADTAVAATQALHAAGYHK